MILGKTIFCCWNLLDVSFFVSCESEEYLVTSLIIVWALTERGSMTWQMKKQMQLGYLKQYFLFTSYLFFKQSCISNYYRQMTNLLITKKGFFCIISFLNQNFIDKALWKESDILSILSCEVLKKCRKFENFICFFPIPP